jgi:hypothetical protein
MDAAQSIRDYDTMNLEMIGFNPLLEVDILGVKT